MLDFSEAGLWVTLSVFTGAAVAVWIAGIGAQAAVETISHRTRLGSAFGGLVLLAVASSLPEVATTITGAVIGDAALVTNNLLGGVAMQTAVLVVADAVLRRGALTFFAPSFSVLLGGVSLVLLLGIVLAVMASGDTLAVQAVGIGTTGLFVTHLTLIYMTYRAGGHPRWQPIRDEQRAEPKRRRTARPTNSEEKSLTRAWISFGAFSLVILGAGWLIMNTAEALTRQTGLGASFVGATLVAMATSLPELSTTTAAVRAGDPEMAISNIFGSNLWDVSFLFVGDIFFRSGPLLGAAPRQAMFTASLGVIMTCIYLWGLLERRQETVGSLGIDSVVALLVYGCGLVVLYGMG